MEKQNQLQILRTMAANENHLVENYLGKNE
jgi:hypothetical protein